MAKHFWVCDCYLAENPRMCSQYLVLASGKRDARSIMQDGEHRVYRVDSWADYHLAMDGLIELKNLTDEEKVDLENGKPVLLQAGT